MSSPSASPDWVEADRRHVWHPYTQMQTAPAPLPVEHAEGVYLHTTDGRKILDGISSWWVNLHGHNHPRLNRALRDQAERFAQIIFAGFTHEPAARLVETLVARTPEKLEHVFYSDDGSTAVEVALKMALQYWRHRGEPKRNLIIALDHAFHGDTFGAMATSAPGSFTAPFQDLFFEVRRAAVPCAGPSSPDAAPLAQILDAEAERVAAVIIEPMVQAAGGMIIWPADFLREIRTLTERSGIPLIADEIFTAFGRTGKLFACEHGPITPDLLCLSKGLTGGYLPLAVTLATDTIYDAFLSEDRRRTFFHGHSFTGNALACAVALESLQLFDDEDRLGRIARLETIFRGREKQLERLSIVRKARSIGGLIALDLEPQNHRGYLDPLGPRLYDEFLRHGLLLRPLGNVLYFLPPYVITDEEVHSVLDTIEDVLRKL